MRTVVAAALVLFIAGAAHTDHALAQQPCEPALDPGEVAVGGRTNPPVDGATVAVRELGLATTTTDGCYVFRHVAPSRNPMLISFEVRAVDYEPLTWLNYMVLFDKAGYAGGLNPPLRPGTKPNYIDFCLPSSELTQPPDAPQRTTAYDEQRQALCAQLPAAGIGPAPTDAAEMQMAVLFVSGLLLLFAAGLSLSRKAL